MFKEFPIKITLKPAQVEKIILKFLGLDPKESKVTFNLSDISDRGGPMYQLTSIEVSTDDVKLWGLVPELRDLDKPKT